MSRRTLEQLRLPAALVLVVIAAFVFFPRGNDADQTADTGATPSPSVIAGQPVGEVLPEEPGSPTASPPPPTGTPAASPSPPPDDEDTATPEPTLEPNEDGFTAEILICRSISGTTCNGEMRNVPPSVSRFTVLVLFTDINAGDELSAVADGPGGTRDGGSYAFESGGNGHFYTTFSPGEPGDHTVTVFRNGDEVASTTYRRVGN